MEYKRFLIGCHVAMKCLETDDWKKIILVYNVLERMRKLLPTIAPQTDLLYAHAMYHFAKAESAYYYWDLEQAVLQMKEVVQICSMVDKLFIHDNSKAKWLLHNLHIRSGARLRAYLSGPRKQFSKNNVCALCGKLHPDKTGSHLVPLLLIKTLFPRFKERTIEENMAMAYSFGYVGRDLAGHIDEIRGYELTDEERELEQFMKNPLTRDYLFCNACEHRFTAIENEMVKVHSLQSQNRSYDYAIPYLFWLSVIWRMSVGKMSIRLDETIEKRIQKILVDCIDEYGKIDTSRVDTSFYYGAAYCEDLRDEPIGILGKRDQGEPYVIIIGNLVLTLFSSKKQADNFRKIDSYMHFNNGTAPEIWDVLPFKIFWDRKELVAFENAEYTMRHLGESDCCDVMFPSLELLEMSENDIRIDIGDTQFLKGKYPWIVPWSLREIAMKKMANPTMDYVELAKNTVYSEEEVEFMMTQWLFREKRMTDHLEKFYKENPLKDEDTFTPELKPWGHNGIMISVRPE